MSNGRRPLGAAFAAFVAATAAICAVFVLGNDLVEQWRRACNPPRPAVAPAMPWYALPLGITGTVLMAAAALLAILARRRLAATSGWQVAATLLLATAVLGMVVAAWFGVYAVLDSSGRPVHCAG
jgi:hypothetical protein